MKQTTRDYTKVLVQIQFIYSNQIFWYKRNIYIYIYRMNIDTNRQRYIHIYTGKR